MKVDEIGIQINHARTTTFGIPNIGWPGYENPISEKWVTQKEVTKPRGAKRGDEKCVVEKEVR